MRAVLVDAGPLVALIDGDDAFHAVCVKTSRSLRQPAVTVWPAFTEAMYLLRFSVDAQANLWELVESGALDFLPLDRSDAPRLRQLMEKYRDLPMDLADAALVRVAEREGIHRIFTLDRRHFTVYRLPGRTRLRILP